MAPSTSASSGSAKQSKLFPLFKSKAAPPPPTSASAAAPPASSNVAAPIAASLDPTMTSTSSAASHSSNVHAPQRVPPQQAAAAGSKAGQVDASSSQVEGSSGAHRQQAEASTSTAHANPTISIDIPSSPVQPSKSTRRVAASRWRKQASSLTDDDDLVIISSESTSFSRPASKKSKCLKATSSGGSTRSSTPVITIQDSPPPKKPSSLFQPLSQLHQASRQARKANEPVEPRWPTEDEHGAGSQARKGQQAQKLQRWQRIASSGKVSAPLRGPEQVADVFAELAAHFPFSTSAEIPSTPLTNAPQRQLEQLSNVSTLLPSFPSHPLLDRIAAPFTATPPTPSSFLRPHDRAGAVLPEENWKDAWTSKYAPKAAGEVLGSTSGRSAGHLKDWLAELAILCARDSSAPKRRRTVTRGAKHPRKKKMRGGDYSDLDGFIASDDDDDDEGAQSDASNADDSDSDNGGGPSFRLGKAPSAQRSVFRSLTNLILLKGPHASGKTSTVHAVANELDWSVFEVYPGIGKRGAKDIERYVGDVGKNHMVRSGNGPGSPKKAAAKSMFAMFRKPQDEGEAPAAVELPATTQSLILFDEVDVLFREEKDFWPGLISLVKQSRRPIILTCTDDSMIPLDDLGLQLVEDGASTLRYLPFDAPSPELAVPFLELIALREGHILSRTAVSSLYASTIHASSLPWLTRGAADPLPHPFPTMPDPAADLRHALTQLQFSCQWGIGDTLGGIGWAQSSGENETVWSVGALPSVEPPKDLHLAHARRLEADQDSATIEDKTTISTIDAVVDSLSFADAYVSRRNVVLLEDHEPPSLQTTADEEISSPVLDAPIPNARQLPFFGRETEIAQSLSVYAPSYLLKFLEQVDTTRAITMSKAATMVACRGLIASPSPILPHPSIFVDYLPYLRLITDADDAHAAAQNDEGSDSGASGRGSRRSARLSGVTYQRALDWTPEEGRLVRESGFDE